MELICSPGLTFAKHQTFHTTVGWKLGMVKQKLQQGPRMPDQWSLKRGSA